MGGALRREVHPLNKWAARILGLLIILAFLLLMLNLQRQLLMIEKNRRATTSTSR